jgi:hypothetical protein
VHALREGTGGQGAIEAITSAGFAIAGTPYADFIHRYFAEG